MPTAIPVLIAPFMKSRRLTDFFDITPPFPARQNVGRAHWLSLQTTNKIATKKKRCRLSKAKTKECILMPFISQMKSLTGRHGKKNSGPNTFGAQKWDHFSLPTRHCSCYQITSGRSAMQGLTVINVIQWETRVDWSSDMK